MVGEQNKSAGDIRYILFALPLGLLLLVLIIKAIHTGYSDFAAYYWGSKFLLAGKYRDVYETYRFNQLIDNEGYKHLFVSFNPFPPFTAIVFLPFIALPIGISKVLFNVVSSIVFINALIRTARHFSISPWILLVIPVLLFSPIRNNILFGQSYLLLFAMLMEGYIAFEKKQNFLCAALWGVAIVFKVFPVLIFLFLLFAKRFKTVAMLAAVCLLCLVVSVCLMGFEPWNLYFNELLPRLGNGELNDSFSQAFQSAQMLLKRLFVPDALLNPGALSDSPCLYGIGVGFFKAVIVSLAIMVSMQKKERVFTAFVVWVLAAFLISPNGSTYSLVLLCLPLLAVFLSPSSTNIKIAVALLVFLICNIPVHYFEGLPALLQFPRLYLTIALFVVIVRSVGSRFNCKVFVPLLLVFVAVQLRSLKLFSAPTIDNSSYLLPAEAHLLIYDYSVQDSSLTYTYWSDTGSAIAKTGIHVNSIDRQDVKLLGNQVYYQSKRLTNSGERKMKPALADKNYIIYLSDKNRGVGFYTLRKLKLN